MTKKTKNIIWSVVTTGVLLLGIILWQAGEDTIESIGRYTALLGFVSAVIQFIMMVTGKNSLSDLFNPKQDIAGPDEIKPGDIYTFGRYKWLVLAKESGKALLITKDIIEKQKYDKFYRKEVTWETCSLRKYLNGEDENKEFRKKFSDEDWNNIYPMEIDNPKNSRYKTPGGNRTYDRVFLLSEAEVREYFVSSKQGVAKFNGESDWWWLRSPGRTPNGIAYAAYVDLGGYVNPSGHYVRNDDGGVRPALWLNL